MTTTALAQGRGHGKSRPRPETLMVLGFRGKQRVPVEIRKRRAGR